MVFPSIAEYPTPTINSFSKEAIGEYINNVNSGAIGAAAWPSANLAIFVPFDISIEITVVKMFWMNGTAGTDSVDVGIYANDGTKIVTLGGAVTSGTTVPQEADIADTTLAPGRYWMAMAMNGTTNTVFRSNAAQGTTMGSFIQQMATAYTLPATATFAVPANAFIPLIGLTINTLL